VSRATPAALLVVAALASSAPPAAAKPAHKPAGRAAMSAPARPVRSPQAVEAHRAAYRTAIADPSAGERSLFAALDRIRSSRALRRGTTAIYLVDAHSGEEIYAVHEDEPMNPASNVKLVSTAAVMSYLGPDWRFATRLFGPTPVDGVATGAVYLRGSWDPTLSAHHLDDIAAQLTARGVTRIDGDLVVGPQPRRDAVASAQLVITVTPGKPGDPPTVAVDGPPSLVDVVITAVTARGRKPAPTVTTEAFTDPAGQERLRVTVAGSIGAGRTRTYRRTPPSLSLFTGHALRDALERAGITVAGVVRTAEFPDYVRACGGSFLPVALAEHRSQTLVDIIRQVNKRSINYLADRLVMLAGAAAYGGDPTMDKGVRLMEHWLSEAPGIAADEVVLDTGSGLSYKTQLSAHQVVRVLREATGAGAADPADGGRDPRLERLFRSSLSVAGQDGTLRRRYAGTPVAGKLVGKTGTLTGIIALSGLLDAGGREVAFSIITNGHVPSQRGTVRDQHRQMVEAIYRYLAGR